MQDSVSFDFQSAGKTNYDFITKCTVLLYFLAISVVMLNWSSPSQRLAVKGDSYWNIFGIVWKLDRLFKPRGVGLAYWWGVSLDQRTRWVTVLGRVNHLSAETATQVNSACAIPPWVGAVNTSKSCEVNRHHMIQWPVSMHGLAVLASVWLRTS